MNKWVRLAAVSMVAVLMLGVFAAPAMASECCPRTPGFWKNHPEAWPVDSIVIGGTTYTKAQAIAAMQQAPGDKTYTLFRALVAARLNVLSGCCPCPMGAQAISDACAWMAENPLGSGVAGSDDAWDCGEQFYCILDAWNNSGS